jgi:hypothetical protein
MAKLSLKRSTSILSRLTSRSNSKSKVTTTTTSASSLDSESPMSSVPPSPSLSTASYNYTFGSEEQFSKPPIAPAPVKMNDLPPNWELRYDTILCQFYYINVEENIVQFDSPLEVVQAPVYNNHIQV